MRCHTHNVCSILIGVASFQLERTRVMRQGYRFIVSQMFTLLPLTVLHESSFLYFFSSFFSFLSLSFLPLLPHSFLLLFSYHLPDVFECLVQVHEEEVPNMEILMTARQEKDKQREYEIIVGKSTTMLSTSCHNRCQDWGWIGVLDAFGIKFLHGLWLSQILTATSALFSKQKSLSRTHGFSLLLHGYEECCMVSHSLIAVPISLCLQVFLAFREDDDVVG